MPTTPKRLVKPMPMKGRYTSAPADQIGQDYSPDALNVRFRFGEAKPAPGRGLFDAAPTNDAVQALSQFGLSTDVLWPFMLTSQKLYRRGNTTPFDTNKWIETTGTFTPAASNRLWSWAAREDHLFFCKGVDTLIEWDGNPAHQFDLVKNVAGFEGVDGAAFAPAPLYMEDFADRLVLANVIENGVTFANRIRWPRRGDYRKWDSTLGLGAGFIDIPTEFAQHLNGIKSLGDRLAVYSPHCIIEVAQTGQLDPAFVYNIRVRGVGLLAPYTIGKANQVHYFLGHDLNVWAWDGIQPQPVGDPIWKELQALVHLDAIGTYFGFVAHKRGEYWLVLADSVRGSYEAFIYDYRLGSWHRDHFPAFTAGDEIEITQGVLTWNDLQGSWDNQNLTWEQLGGTSTSVIVGGRNDGSTMIVDDMFVYDYFALGSIMTCYLATEDHYLPEDPIFGLLNVLRVILVYDPASSTSDPISVAVSFNQGVEWTTKNVVPDGTGYQYVDFNVTGRVARYKFTEANANVQFRYRSYAWEYIPGGDALPGT